MFYGNRFGPAGSHPGEWIFFIVVLVVLLVALAWLVRLAMHQRAGAPFFYPHQHQGPEPQPQALQILDERFARGEIDEDEYKRRRDALRERP